jgi:anti-sigma regulatory factor (Ser/Thr protein kinase)
MIDDCLVVEVEDQSPAEKLPAQSDGCDPSLERGRGVLMMRALMDECHDCRTERGIKITMAKQLTARTATKDRES